MDFSPSCPLTKITLRKCEQIVGLVTKTLFAFEFQFSPFVYSEDIKFWADFELVKTRWPLVADPYVFYFWIILMKVYHWENGKFGIDQLGY